MSKLQSLKFLWNKINIKKISIRKIEKNKLHVTYYNFERHFAIKFKYKLQGS